MENLLIDIENETALVKINRPEVLNALNTQTLKELNEAFSDIKNRKDIKVVILTGQGEKSFVAGADIHEMANATPKEGRDFGLLAFETFKKNRRSTTSYNSSCKWICFRRRMRTFYGI